jgi:3-oxoacyl-[acyl-carrier-protein] synthase-3
VSLRSVIKGVGGYLPQNIVTNKDLEKRVDTSDEWVVQRTGIKQRHLAEEHETTSMMATKAAQDALSHAGMSIDQIDAIIVATTTPDRTFPATAVHVQAALAMTHGFAFDVQAVCSGFVYALSVADGMIRSGQVKNILVLGAEKMSSIIDWSDRTTCVLFADGAGGVVLSAEENTDRGILSTHLHSNGAFKDMLYTDGGASTTGNVGVIKMQGKEVFKYAVTYLAEVVEEVLTHNNLPASAIDWLVPHQANIRIIEATAKKLDMSMDKVVLTVQDHGNTSAASIPLALNTAVKDGRIKRGDLILTEALGGGFTWGAALIRF